jgi:hypothetical protein
MRQYLGVGQRAPRARRLDQQRVQRLDVDQTGYSAASALA